MMMKWEKKATDDKTYANAVTFFYEKMTSIETHQENSGNLAKKNGFESANAAVEIADKMKEILQEHIGSNEEKSNAKHLIQMSTLRSAKDLQDSEMSNMQKEISTLTRALTTLTHKMMDRSSKHGSGGYESDRGYATEDSKTENSHQHNTRGRGRPNRRKFDDVEKKHSYAERLNTKGWKYILGKELSKDLAPEKRKWFLAGRKEASWKLRQADPKKWRKIQKKILQKQLEELES